MYREIIILAKSSKKGGYCIAGVDTVDGKWIRPITNNTINEGAVPINDIRYSDGSEVQILDIVKIKTISHNPTKAQPENYLYDNKERWIKTGTSSLDDVIKFRGYDNVNNIFYNDRKDVLESELGGQGSLMFINVKNSCIFIKTFSDGNRKIQLNCEYNNLKYKYLAIRDKVIEEEFLNKDDGVYKSTSDLSVVISLTDKYLKKDKYYKIVAQLFY